MDIKHVILKNLVYNNEYTKKALPFLREEYFSDVTEKFLYTLIEEFISKYNTNPSIESLVIQLNSKKISEDEYTKSLELLEEIQNNKDDESNIEWLLDKTEEFCQDQAVYNAIIESLAVIEGKNKTFTKGSIPQLLTNALAVSFDQNVGHDFIDNYEDRYEFYHRVEERIPFGLKFFDMITDGGLPKGTLNLFVAITNAGKTGCQCHCAAHYLTIGKNVLYITLEMAEEEIAKRIDANLMNIPMNDLKNMPKETFFKKIENLKKKVLGKLIIKQYPTSSAGVFHFRALLNELNLKKGFKPDIIIIDYLNICASSRIKMGSAANMYSYVKSVAEEIRGLAVEFNVPILSASQFNRAGNNSDPDMDKISESFGVSMTADWMVALIATEELSQLGQLLVKQIKTRYSDININRKFIIGFDRAKSLMYDVENSAQYDIVDSGQQPNKDNNKFNSFLYDEEY